MKRSFRAFATVLAVSVVATLAGLSADRTAARSSTPEIPVAPGESRAHVIFDDTTGPARPGIAQGGRAQPLLHPRIDLGPRRPLELGSRAVQPAVAPPDPEVLGFAQAGELTSGSWRTDLRLDLLSTVAYFGINLNGDGSINNDAGYQGWWSSQTTSMINAAHAASDRVVVTVKAFGSAGIESIVGNSQYRQATINAIVGQLQTRGGDGVNVDFEGYTPTVSAADFTTFVAQLQFALRTRVPSQSFLTVDTYGSSAAGGTMMDIRGLRPYVDAFDVMAYDTTGPCSANAGPNAPLANYPYSDSQEVSQYLALVPPSQVILGIPYYGYKWSVTQPASRAPTRGCASADTYAGILSDFSCASQLSKQWDTNFASPWATWWSPATGDPCGGNHNSWRELYYDNAQSLGMKYDLVNTSGLRGIGIWALGYDSGSADLWNEIGAKFSVTHHAVSTTLPSAADVYTVSLHDGWAGVQATGLHELTAASNYQGFGANGLTGLGQTSTGVWTFVMGAYNPANGLRDFIAIDTKDWDGVHSGTGVHVFTAASSYQRSSVGRISPLGQTDVRTWTFMPGAMNANGLPDIIAVDRSDMDPNTGRTGTGIHILSGASGYQSFLFNGLANFPVTPLHQWLFVTGNDGSAGAHRPDVVAINLQDVGNAGACGPCVGIHVISGVWSYQSRLAETPTTMPSVSDSTWAFISGGQDPALQYRDVIAVDSQDAGRTGVLVISAGSVYQQQSLEVASGLGATDLAGWAFPSTPPLY